MYKYIDMSIFRPINSDESNLSIIRCVVTFILEFNDANIIAGGNNITKNTDLLLLLILPHQLLSNQNHLQLNY